MEDYSSNNKRDNNPQSEVLTLPALKSQIEDLQRLCSEAERFHRHYLQLFDYAPTSYLKLNDNGVIVKSNHAAGYMLGLTLDKLTSKRLTSFVADESKDQWTRFFLMSRQYESIQSCELKLIRADGNIIHVLAKSLYKQLEDEGPKLLLLTLKDITTYNKTEAALKVAAVAFETQEAIIVTDANKIILRVNRAFTRITGYSAEEAIGNPPAFLCSGQYEESFHQSIWISALNNGFWQGEIWERRKDGEPFPAWLTLTAVLDEDGCVSNYVCSFNDNSAQKQAEKILLAARQRLENQMTSTKEELELVKQQKVEINAALTVLLKHRETDMYQSQQALSREVEETICHS